jgi:hypothetical protein
MSSASTPRISTSRSTGIGNIGGTGLCRRNKVLRAVVVTIKVVDDPAAALAGLKLQVETGGQPASVNVTVPESGGEKVVTVNEVELPALMEFAPGEAATPAGAGPLKVNTVLPPHSKTFGVAPLHKDASNAVTMK